MLPKIMREIKNKLSLSGGTITGDVTVNASLTATNISGKAELLKPSMAITPELTSNDTQIATTAFVQSVVSDHEYQHPTSSANGSYGTVADTTLTSEGIFKVPYITINDLGHVTSASDISLKLPPSEKNVDEKVKQTLSTTSGNYPLLASDSTSTTTKTASAIITTGITLDPAMQKLIASLFVGDLQGNADTATKLKTSRTISLTGDVTGLVSFDGSQNISMTTTGVQASKLKTARTVSLTGAVTGSASFDGSSNVSIATTLAKPAITVSTASPSGGSDGDIWFKVI